MASRHTSLLVFAVADYKAAKESGEHVGEAALRLFTTCVEEGEPIPADLLQFVAAGFSAMLEPLPDKEAPTIYRDQEAVGKRFKEAFEIDAKPPHDEWLTEKQIEICRDSIFYGKTQVEIAADHHLSKGAVSKLLRDCADRYRNDTRDQLFAQQYDVTATAIDALLNCTKHSIILEFLGEQEQLNKPMRSDLTVIKSKLNPKFRHAVHGSQAAMIELCALLNPSHEEYDKDRRDMLFELLESVIDSVSGSSREN